MGDWLSKEFRDLIRTRIMEDMLKPSAFAKYMADESRGEAKWESERQATKPGH